MGDVHLALEGLPSKSLGRLKAGAQWIDGGIATILSFTIIAVIIMLLGISLGKPVMAAIAMLNELLGILIGMPLILAGKIGTKRATRLLSPKETGQDKRALNVQPSDRMITGTLKSTQAQLSPPASVTDNTTLNLKEKLVQPK